ncbi:MAG: pyrroline-5-carboxylate reductase [bacterium]|nr:pyrroline-5-carboxylate reductase [bacterium]
MLEDKKLAILGAGKIGETLLRGLLDAGLVERSNVLVTAAHPERTAFLADELGVAVAADNRAAVQAADVVLLCVKPQMAEVVVPEIASAMTPDKLLVSVLASVTTAALEQLVSGAVPVVRAMPNTPSFVKCGMTGLVRGAHASDAHLALTRMLFDAVGRTVVVDEKHMDAVTGLSASGPAFLYIVIESLAEGGVKMGLPRDVATQLAAQTVVGAGSMVIERGLHPAALKDEVTTPAGCTMDGILELEDGGLRVTLIKAVVCATQRARGLVND